MQIAYLVFAYKNPKVLQRTIERLSGADCAFFIHIDRKSDIGLFQNIRGENIEFTKERLTVYWAEFSGVEAILLLLREGMKDPRRFDYFVLLSGSEYPVRSRDYIHRYFQNNRGCEFINLAKMPAPGKPLSRLNTLRLPSDKPIRRFLVRVLAKCGLANRDYRRHFGDLEPYSGITWWALSRSASQYILRFVEQNPKFSDFFRDVFAPEETFFHTIIGNSEFKARVRRNVLYEDWTAQGAHPALVGERHLAVLGSRDRDKECGEYGPGEVLFARKFSDDRLEILDRIDELI